MFIDQFYSEFEMEFKGTRRVLENLDFSKFDYKPHPKSFTFKHLALHVANMPNWGFLTLKSNEYRMTPEETSLDTDAPETKEALLQVFDENVKKIFRDIKRDDGRSDVGDLDIVFSGQAIVWSAEAHCSQILCDESYDPSQSTAYSLSANE